MATKNRPTKTQSSTQSKQFAIFKTVVPLALTFLLLGLVYFFILVPESPNNVLKRAILNFTDTSKYYSMRYDGVFEDEISQFNGEFSGQFAQNGNREMTIKIIRDDKTSEFSIKIVDDNKYYKLSGASNLNYITEKVAGLKPVDAKYIELITKYDNVWIKLDDTTDASKLLLCEQDLPIYWVTDGKLMTSDTYPFEVTKGPYSGTAKETERNFDAKLIDHNRSVLESSVFGLVECLDGLRADDPSLRDINDQDLQTMKIKFTVDISRDVVTGLTLYQIGQSFQVEFRDYNKDVFVTTPDTAVSSTEIPTNILSL